VVPPPPPFAIGMGREQGDELEEMEPRGPCLSWEEGAKSRANAFGGPCLSGEGGWLPESVGQEGAKSMANVSGGPCLSGEGS
jgi:hypothetical protein